MGARAQLYFLSILLLYLNGSDALFSSNTPSSISSIRRPKPPKLGTVNT